MDDDEDPHSAESLNFGVGDNFLDERIIADDPFGLEGGDVASKVNDKLSEIAEKLDSGTLSEEEAVSAIRELVANVSAVGPTLEEAEDGFEDVLNQPGSSLVQQELDQNNVLRHLTNKVFVPEEGGD